jgi:hypothetical protein
LLFEADANIAFRSRIVNFRYAFARIAADVVSGFNKLTMMP